MAWIQQHVIFKNVFIWYIELVVSISYLYNRAGYEWASLNGDSFSIHGNEKFENLTSAGESNGTDCSIMEGQNLAPRDCHQRNFFVCKQGPSEDCSPFLGIGTGYSGP